MKTQKEIKEEYFKIEIEQNVLNNLLDSGKITLDEKYYHERSIKLMKEAQEWGFQKSQEMIRKEIEERIKHPIYNWDMNKLNKKIIKISMEDLLKERIMILKELLSKIGGKNES